MVCSGWPVLTAGYQRISNDNLIERIGLRAIFFILLRGRET